MLRWRAREGRGPHDVDWKAEGGRRKRTQKGQEQERTAKNVQMQVRDWTAFVACCTYSTVRKCHCGQHRESRFLHPFFSVIPVCQVQILMHTLPASPHLPDQITMSPTNYEGKRTNPIYTIYVAEARITEREGKPGPLSWPHLRGRHVTE